MLTSFHYKDNFLVSNKSTRYLISFKLHNDHGGGDGINPSLKNKVILNSTSNSNSELALKARSTLTAVPNNPTELDALIVNHQILIYNLQSTQF